mgnify:CR=1 FL=1
MTIDLILFLILAVVAIATALGMLLSRNAVYSALFLVLNFATVAVFYLLLGAPFIALTQVTVYAGAIMVLFLFVIMLLGTEELPERKVLNWQKPMAVGLAVILMVEGIYLIFVQKSASGLISNAPTAEFGSPQAIGELLFRDYLLPFEVTSVLLLVAMVGAIVLTINKKGGQS